MVFAAVLFCFFVSGMAGLVYQVAWARYLALFLGHTSYAVIAVLVAFMGGLALGNAWFGALADRSSKPLAFYGWLEVGIGIYAVIFPHYYALCDSVCVKLAASIQPGSAFLLLLKFGFSLLTILLPTILMGATFPVLTRFVTGALAELKEKVAALYCINSAGAVAGCLFADFWAIKTAGIEITVYMGAAMNFAAGLIALLLSSRLNETAKPRGAGEQARPEAAARFTPKELRLAVIGIGLSGFVAMLYEVAWTRLLALALGSSTHAFSLMLITFIAGIAVGAWVIYLWKGLAKILEAFAWAEIALGATLLVSMFFYADLPYWFSKLAQLLARRPEAYPVYEFLQALVCFAVMFIPTVCLGMTLPLVSRIATAELAGTGRSVGKVFAINTMGTVLGAVVTGLVLMPAFGLPRTFMFGIVANALIGILILARNNPWRALRPAIIAGCLLIWAAGPLFDRPWQNGFSLGLWRTGQTIPSRAAFRSMIQRGTLKFYRDGAGGTVTVNAFQQNGKPVLTLAVNGKVDASTGADMPTQALIGHLPLLLRPESRDALVVGVGSGITCGAVAMHDSIRRVDAVEISPEVVEAARLFSAYNYRVLENPKLHLAIEDAKSFLKIGTNQYDAIISEPSNPWMAGVAGVFTREYYERCRARLKPGGIVAQWVQIYETSDEIVNLVLRTFTSVFPYASVWHSTFTDLILIGTVEPLAPDLDRMQKEFNQSLVSQDMERIDLTRLSALLAREIVPQQNGLFLPPPEGPVHSDFFPVLEYMAQEAFFLKPFATRWKIFDENLSPRPGTLLGKYLAKHSLTEADFKAFGRFYLDHHLPDDQLLRSLALRWQAEQPASTTPLELTAGASAGARGAEAEALRLRPFEPALMERAARDPEPLRIYESHLMETYRARRSAFYLPPGTNLVRVLERLVETNPANRRVYRLHLAELAWDRADDKSCFELARQAFDPEAQGGPMEFAIDPAAPRQVLYRMIETLWRAGRLKEASDICQQARTQGYAGGETPLDLTIRKVGAYAATSGFGGPRESETSGRTVGP